MNSIPQRGSTALLLVAVIGGGAWHSTPALAQVRTPATVTAPALPVVDPSGAETWTGTPTVAQISPSEPVSDVGQAPSIVGILREVPIDLVRFVSVDTALVLGVGGGAAAIAHIWDDDVANEVATNQQLNNAFEPGSKYGAFTIMVGGAFAVYGVGRVARKSHLAVVGADLVRGQIVSQVWVQALKHTVQRERPDKSDRVSFPSGHAAGGFSAATVLARHYGWKGALPAYAGATYIAIARIHDNKHFLSDVTFGAAMGIAGSRTVLRTGRYRLHLTPAVTRTGAALNVSVMPSRP